MPDQHVTRWKALNALGLVLLVLWAVFNTYLTIVIVSEGRGIGGILMIWIFFAVFAMLIIARATTRPDQ